MKIQIDIFDLKNTQKMLHNAHLQKQCQILHEQALPYYNSKRCHITIASAAIY